MNKGHSLSGVSLIEVLIGAMLFLVMALGITKTMRNHVFVLYKSDLMTTAAALASDIASRIKTQPFNDIYSFDSGIPHPSRPYYGLATFKPDDYLIDIDASRIKPVLEEIQNVVKQAGFDRFKLGITYLRRDSTDNATFNGFVDDYAYWGKSGHVPKTGIAHIGCDYGDDKLCFGDYNNDGDYWDIVGDVTETPNSGLKMLTVTIYKNNEPVGVKTGTLLSQGNFSGNEIQDSQSPLKLKINYPKKDIWVMQATPDTMAALELPTRRTYSKSRWNRNTGAVIRIDTNDALSPVLNKKIDLNGTHISSASNPDQFTLMGGGNNLIRFAGLTDPGVSGKLRVYDSYGTSAFAGMFTPTEVQNFFPTSENWEIWNGAQRFTTLSGPSYLMRDGNHWLWSRKESLAVSGVFSPFDVRRVRVDYGIPRITQFSPNSAIYSKGGLSPYNCVIISDYFKVGGGASNYSGVVPEVVSAIVKNVTDDLPPIHYYRQSLGASNNLSYSVAASSSYFTLRDSEWFPTTFLHSKDYRVTWEFGDYVGYKGTYTYTFKIPNPVTEEETVSNTPPSYVVHTSYPATFPVIVGAVPAGGYTRVNQNVKYSFLPLYFYDSESGVDLRKFKLEVCKDVPLVPMQFMTETPNCKTVYEYPRMRPDGNAWGSWFYIAPLGNTFRTYATATFSNPGVGILAGQNYPVGSKWKIRAYIENWAGLSTTTGDEDWKIEIVP